MIGNKTAHLIACLAGILAVVPAHARPDTRTMTCTQAQTFVKQNKAIVMSTGPNTYERIVVGQGYCGPSQVTKLMIAPTVDQKKCRVGNYCEEAPFDR